MVEDCVKPIHIERLFESKNPRLARMIPTFVYSYLKKVLHQDEINDFISRYGDRKGLAFYLRPYVLPYHGSAVRQRRRERRNPWP